MVLDKKLIKEPRVPPLVWVILLAAMQIGSRWPLVDYHASIFALSFAAVFILLGVGLCGASLYQFIRFKTTVDPRTPKQATHLLTSGLFSYSRNPMYLGFLCVLVGLTCYLGGNFQWLSPLVFFCAMHYVQIPFEERAMHATFKDVYDDYTRTVRRWL